MALKLNVATPKHEYKLLIIYDTLERQKLYDIGV